MADAHRLSEMSRACSRTLTPLVQRVTGVGRVGLVLGWGQGWGARGGGAIQGMLCGCA